MGKRKTVYICQSCGYEAFRWLGKCPECEGWNTFSEEMTDAGPVKKKKTAVPFKTVPLTDLQIRPESRIMTGIQEFDRVLGGGLVEGAVILIGGAPGIGKSTLLLQTCGLAASEGLKILYISGEESLRQIKLRADRIGIESENFHLAAENDVDTIVEMLDSVHPDLAVIDSIQTVFSEQMESVPGNISQVRYCGHRLTLTAKKLGIPVFFVGHVTKEGSLAGPRVLEHLVDCLLLLEGDSQHHYRILRTAKNRFGSTNEVGLFEMTGQGIREVKNPSAYLISQKRDDTPGTTVTVTLEGSRPLLIEIQALVTPTSYGIPQRTATGFDHRRLTMLLAVLEKKMGFKFGNQDVFVNVAGGIRLQEPAADLSVITALVSSLQEKTVSPESAIIGEVGLTGEVRGVTQSGKRVSEASRLGFKHIVIPGAGSEDLETFPDIKVDPVNSIEQLIRKLF